MIEEIYYRFKKFLLEILLILNFIPSALTILFEYLIELLGFYEVEKEEVVNNE